MYTTDSTYKKVQRDHARRLITRLARQYASPVRRLKELEWHHTVYQALGDWQDALDIIENAMLLIGGFKEQVENKSLYERYDALLKATVVAETKGDWDETDHILLGKARAYSEARYLLRFYKKDHVIATLEEKRLLMVQELADSVYSSSSSLSTSATVNAFAELLEHLKHS
jgi:hypothetical protein